MLRPTTIPYSKQCQPWSGPSYQCTLPYSVRLSGLHPTPCATPYNYSLQQTVSTMEWAFLLMHSILPCTIEWTPPYPLCYAVQLFLRRSPFERTPSYSVHLRLSGLHPTPCATPYNYSLQQTVSTMEWALLSMHPTQLSTIEWTPPYPLCYTLQLFLTANCVNHGVGPLINALYPTLCTIEWTPPYPLCYALQLFLTVNSVNNGVGPLINTLHPNPCATPYNYSLQ